jgi:hypothetical protein
VLSITHREEVVEDHRQHAAEDDEAEVDARVLVVLEGVALHAAGGEVRHGDAVDAVQNVVEGVGDERVRALAVLVAVHVDLDLALARVARVRVDRAARGVCKRAGEAWWCACAERAMPLVREAPTRCC